jgi:hypothetical protein
VKQNQFRPALDDIMLEDRVVMTARFPSLALAANALFAPIKPVVTAGQISQVGIAINTSYVGATPISALNQAKALNAANPAVTTAGTGTQTLAQAQAYLNSLITLFSGKLAQGTKANMLTLPGSAAATTSIITSTNNLLAVPVQNALTALNNIAAPTQTDIDTAINAGHAAATPANIQAAAKQANAILQGYKATVTVIPTVHGFRR